MIWHGVIRSTLFSVRGIPPAFAAPTRRSFGVARRLGLGGAETSWWRVAGATMAVSPPKTSDPSRAGIPNSPPGAKSALGKREETGEGVAHQPPKITYHQFDAQFCSRRARQASRDGSLGVALFDDDRMWCSVTSPSTCRQGGGSQGELPLDHSQSQISVAPAAGGRLKNLAFTQSAAASSRKSKGW